MDKINVMIVDDNINLVGMLKEYFKTVEDINIIAEAYNGEDGLELLKEIQNDVDVLLLDLIMPKRDGVWFLKEMQTNKIDVKTIVETSYNAQDTIREVSEFNIKYFILKPYDLNYLKERIYTAVKTNKSIQQCEVEARLTTLLHELGVPSHIKGYKYLKESILLVYNNKDYIGAITKQVYPEIASIYSTTVSRVERAIRHAIEVGTNRSDPETLANFFGTSIHYDKDKPTNSEYIVTVAESLEITIEKERVN